VHLEWRREMNWYMDRDFPEIKIPRSGEPAEIFPVTSDRSHIQKIIDAHNTEIDAKDEEIAILRHQKEKLKVALRNIAEQFPNGYDTRITEIAHTALNAEVPNLKLASCNCSFVLTGNESVKCVHGWTFGLGSQTLNLHLASIQVCSWEGPYGESKK
jgi:hypothetical protein